MKKQFQKYKQKFLDFRDETKEKFFDFKTKMKENKKYRTRFWFVIMICVIALAFLATIPVSVFKPLI